MSRRKRRFSPTLDPAVRWARARSELVRVAHDQLDALLGSPAELPGGRAGTVADDLLARELAGYGFRVTIEVRHPEEEGRAQDTAPALSDLLGPDGQPAPSPTPHPPVAPQMGPPGSDVGVPFS